MLTDPAGDSGTAPDITSVEIANDASGYVAVRVGLLHRPTHADVRIVVAIDSDANPATGLDGTDYLLLAAPSTGGYALARWDGTQFVDTPESTLSAGGDANSFTFSLNRSELGNTGQFNFWVRSVQGSTFEAGHYDSVPDSGSSNYALGAEAPIRLMLERSHADRARSGKPFAAYIVVARSDIVLPDVTPDEVSCAARVGTHALATTTRGALGSAGGCLWSLPRHARGKVVHASVSVTLDGVTITKSFAARIK